MKNKTFTILALIVIAACCIALYVTKDPRCTGSVQPSICAD